MRKFKIVYNSETDSFEIWTRIERCDEWDLLVSSKCRAIGDNIETNYIHFSILNEVKNLLSWGYKYAD